MADGIWLPDSSSVEHGAGAAPAGLRDDLVGENTIGGPLDPRDVRMVLDRRSLEQVPNAPRRRAHADARYCEENIMESYFYPEIDHHIGSGP